MLPDEVVLEPGRLRLAWPDGGSGALGFAALRGCCRCSACQATRLRGETVHYPADVAVHALTLIGQYGVQLHFSDGHERGIYPWPLLWQLSDGISD